MNEVFYVIICSVLDVLKYFICLIVIFNIPLLRKKTSIIGIVGILFISSLVSVIYYLINNDSGIPFLLPNICSLLFIIGLDKGKKIKGILFIFLSWLITDSLSEIIGLITAALGGSKDSILGTLSEDIIYIKLYTISFIVVYHIIVNLIIKKRINYTYSISQCVVLILSFIGLLMIVPSIEKIGSGISISEEEYTGMCISLIALLFFFLAIMTWQSYIIQNNLLMKEQERTYQYMMKIQSTHFNNLIKKDEDLRRFRHDLRAHLATIRGFASNNNDLDVLNYLSNVEHGINQTKAQRYTGNAAIDSVINELSSQMDAIGISFKCEGLFMARKDIIDFDLCTIIYNVLQNAIDAAQIIDIPDKTIVLKFKCIGDKLGISISNNTILKSLPKNGNLISSKEDKANHGLGIQNVKNVVKKYDGIYSNELIDGRFVVDIII